MGDSLCEWFENICCRAQLLLAYSVRSCARSRSFARSFSLSVSLSIPCERVKTSICRKLSTKCNLCNYKSFFFSFFFFFFFVSPTHLFVWMTLKTSPPTSTATTATKKMPTAADSANSVALPNEFDQAQVRFRFEETGGRG
jgi:hypothetical protein